MKSRSILAAIAAVAAAVVLLPSTPAGAQETTSVYAVHGLNLDGQDAQDDGGTNVTVCAGDAELIPDFQFGQIVGPVELPTDEAVNLKVYGGAEVDCTAPGAATLLIDDDVTPEGAAVAVVAAQSGEDAVLQGFPIDVECTEEGGGRIVAAHASGDTPTVALLVDDDEVGTFDFGETLTGDESAGTYSVAVTLDGTPVIGPVDIPVAAQSTRVVYAVGNVGGNTPVVPLLQEITVDTCDGPTPPPAPEPTIPVTTEAPVTPITPAPSASPSTAEAPIAFTG